MSQYFTWVNFTKRQFLQDAPFPCGLRYTESCYVGNLKTDAASTLLAKEWRGDLVAFTGEYLFDLREAVKSGRYPGLARLLDIAIDPVDVEHEFEDVAGRFTFARGKHGWVPGIDEDGEETMRQAPYEGPFDLEVTHYRFMVNETKHAYYDRESTQPLTQAPRFDMLPLLLGTSWGRLLVNGKLPEAPKGSLMASAPDGLWVGDPVYPSDVRPDNGYEDVSELYTLAL